MSTILLSPHIVFCFNKPLQTPVLRRKCLCRDVRGVDVARLHRRRFRRLSAGASREVVRLYRGLLVWVELVEVVVAEHRRLSGGNLLNRIGYVNFTLGCNN